LTGGLGSFVESMAGLSCRLAFLAMTVDEDIYLERF